MRDLNPFMHSGCVRIYENTMDVRNNKCRRVDGNADSMTCSTRPFIQYAQEHLLILIVRVNRLPPIASGRYVMQGAGKFDTQQASNDCSVAYSF